MTAHLVNHARRELVPACRVSTSSRFANESIILGTEELTMKTLLVLCLGLLVVGCGGGGEDITIGEICKRMDDCPWIAGTSCMSIYGDMKLSSECKKRLINASCEEFLNSLALEKFHICWPPCGQEESSCKGDILAECDENFGHLFKYDCHVICEGRGLEFGKCGVDEFGEPFCACR